MLSPDGTRVVYISGSPARLYTRRLDQTKANELPGTEGAVMPFFSPDGLWIGFFEPVTEVPLRAAHVGRFDCLTLRSQCRMIKVKSLRRCQFCATRGMRNFLSSSPAA
jgi:hypothetical protein